MLDHYQKCPYCEKKTCYLVIGYIGEPGGDEVRCYSCKRQWLTDWAHLTKRAADGLRRPRQPVSLMCLMSSLIIALLNPPASNASPLGVYFERHRL